MSGQIYNDSGIDKSLGLLVLGLIVGGFVLLMIVGMDGMQKASRSLTAPVQQVPEKAEPAYDFVQ
ncbi:MAG TPA: hypothetical protein VNQ76_16535 [Planctomicrobium sp.]|nr:hypothetical protein [Planctomicrobium sp.]